MMNLNGKQLIAITIAVLGVLIGSTAQLTDLFGPGTTKAVVSIASLGNSVLSSILAVISSQGSQVRDVLAMPGVSHIDVNEKANSTLATMAMDSTIDNIAPTPAAATRVAATAKASQ